MPPTAKVRLGLGMAAVYQSFVREDSVTLVARSYESLNKLDSIAYASKAAEAAALRFANGADAKAASECRQDLADLHALFADLDSVADGGMTAAFRTLRDRLSEVLAEQSTGLDAALDSTSPMRQLAQLMSVRDASGARLQLQSAVQSLRTVVRQNLDDRVVYQTATAGRARRLFMTAGILCMVLIVLAGWQLSLDFSRREIFGRARARRNEQYRAGGRVGDRHYVWDSEGRFTYWNPAALQLLIEPDQVERFYMRQNARNRWIGLNAQVLIKDNEIAGFQAIARDLTERRKLETSTARRQEFMERLAANRPGILHVFDLADRKTTFTNREIAAVLGYKPEDRGNFDQLAMRLFHPDDLSAVRTHHDAEVLRLEYRARHADGNWSGSRCGRVPSRVTRRQSRTDRRFRARCQRASRRAREADVAGELRYAHAPRQPPACNTGGFLCASSISISLKKSTIGSVTTPAMSSVLCCPMSIPSASWRKEFATVWARWLSA